MKKFTVILLAALSVAYAGYVDAATPKKRPRSANRIGAYGGGHVGYSMYAAENAAADEEFFAFLHGCIYVCETLRANSPHKLEPADIQG